MNGLTFKQKLVLIAVLEIVLMLCFAFAMFKLIRQNSECVNNPLIYGASKIIGKDGQVLPALCNCEGNTFKFYFDSKGIYAENPLFNI